MEQRKVEGLRRNTTTRSRSEWATCSVSRQVVVLRMRASNTREAGREVSVERNEYVVCGACRKGYGGFPFPLETFWRRLRFASGPVASLVPSVMSK